MDERFHRLALTMMHDANNTNDGSGRLALIGPDTRLECKICWTVYDPALGDEVWQVPPGTPFGELPAHWTCPNCSALKQDFLVLDE